MQFLSSTVCIMTYLQVLRSFVPLVQFLQLPSQRGQIRGKTFHLLHALFVRLEMHTCVHRTRAHTHR